MSAIRRRKIMLKKIIASASFAFCLLISANIAFGQKVVTAAQVNGTWRETSSKANAVSTEFRVWSLGGQKLQVEFFGNNAAGKVSNTASGTAMIEGTTATFQPADAQANADSPCVMTLKFGGGKLVVSEIGDCGWGRGIGSDGNYKKISAKKPKFDE
jgi:hypothetical protein